MKTGACMLISRNPVPLYVPFVRLKVTPYHSIRFLGSMSMAQRRAPGVPAQETLNKSSITGGCRLEIPRASLPKFAQAVC